MTELTTLEVGSEVQSIAALVEKKSIANTKAGKPYLRFTLRDKKGSLDGVCWDWPSDSQLKEGDVVLVTGKIDQYNGSKQLVARELTVATTKNADDFAKQTKFNVDTLWSEVVDIMDGFVEPLTKFVVEEILTKHQEVVAAIKRAPAARGVHNAWYGGLIEHIWSLCKIADPIISHYRKNYLEYISRDKVMFGLMMHDAGKIIEYDFSTPAFRFTDIGSLTNHLVMGPAWVYEKANQWWSSNKDKGVMTVEEFKLERAHLMHVLAAHHGQIEWGSPVRPASIEAVLVHHLDNLDSKVLHAWEFITTKKGDLATMSQNSYIEKTAFLIPKEMR